MGCAGCGSCKCGDNEKKSPEEINSYYNGLMDGAIMYAWWKDGVQYVGTTGRLLAEALEKIDAQRIKALEK